MAAANVSIPVRATNSLLPSGVLKVFLISSVIDILVMNSAAAAKIVGLTFYQRAGELGVLHHLLGGGDNFFCWRHGLPG